MQVWAPTSVIFHLCDRESERETKNDFTAFLGKLVNFFFLTNIASFKILQHLT